MLWILEMKFLVWTFIDILGGNSRLSWETREDPGVLRAYGKK